MIATNLTIIVSGDAHTDTLNPGAQRSFGDATPILPNSKRLAQADLTSIQAFVSRGNARNVDFGINMGDAILIKMHFNIGSQSFDRLRTGILG